MRPFLAWRQHNSPVLYIGVQGITCPNIESRRSGPGRTTCPFVETLVCMVRQSYPTFCSFAIVITLVPLKRTGTDCEAMTHGPSPSSIRPRTTTIPILCGELCQSRPGRPSYLQRSERVL